MTDNTGTLAGLIADLEEQHPPYPPQDQEEPAFCMFCGTRPDRLVWPCPTIELVRKHKRAMYKVVGDYTEPGGYTRYHGAGDVFWVYDKTARDVKTTGSKAECEAWIDRQVNGE